MKCIKAVRAILSLFALLAAPMAAAQLYGDFVPREPHPVNVYFGWVKNAEGDYVEGATVVLKTALVEYVAVTDIAGRFRVDLPLTVTPQQVEALCSRDGYSSARVTRRLPRGDALTPVEISCHLKRTG